MKSGIKRFITCHIPVSACNFKCSYCYVAQIKEDTKKILPFIIPEEVLGKKLSKRKLGGTCYFNLCGNGETMLHPQLVGLVDVLTKEGHFVDIITNGTISARIDELLELLNKEQQRHLFIKFSFHYHELLRTGLLDEFVLNINKIKKSYISYTIEVTPYDELVKDIGKIKKFSLAKFGAYPHVTVARNEATDKIKLLTKYSKAEYRKVWSQFESELFDFKFRIFNQKRKEFCYAGEWSLEIELETGIYRQCYKCCELGNVCDDLPINFRAVGKCPLPHCFNGHAFLAFGNIPELATPTYCQERNRIMQNGEEWLKSECKDFFTTKLYDNNDKMTWVRKMECVCINKFETYKKLINRVKNKLVRTIR